METIVFATANQHKVREVNQLIGDQYNILSLKDIGCEEDIPETQDTIAGNAQQKARYLKAHYGHDCFAEDTGLEIDALDGAPGVYTARYAGPQRDPQDNMQLVLEQLADTGMRSARFRTVIALILEGKEYLFEGVAEGEIAEQQSGTEGFGYDPIFVPEGYDQTFAELDSAEKNAISHRGKAVEQLAQFLKNYHKQQ
ncbi:non-canonical purine NTP diphosphatase [Flavilitoribacter nigricans]|uniref:dITP/XTP pyrophosphatase n=1 Tax=Flavilitoribacter nigricans (strain ATCC 23147 / DSM 23189 / NBRC 102662 / NCIMB 1420 / SS-2) TaxID=1122177 RepID=A0A2D0N9Z6_FLAN2|nr:non-canonical purine NTP diphosphatase [Flavilitoribacter nigricans]PHN05305.1 non-canonical purine NTP pyrophosphatase [Flavilitoribacter nigricans DSM 23189 = NBRC 102662]